MGVGPLVFGLFRPLFGSYLDFSGPFLASQKGMETSSTRDLRVALGHLALEFSGPFSVHI